MQNQVSKVFMQALQQTEQTGDVSQLVEMFADDAEISNLSLKEPMRGKEGAREFWQSYLQQFDHIRSEFTEVSEVEGKAFLEWKAQGALRGGHPISYEGVTILKIEQERIKRFYSYYDSAAFIQVHSQAK